MSRYRYAVLFAYLAVGWGASFTAIEIGLAYVDPVLFSALRFDIAALVMLAYVALRGEFRPRTRDDLAAILVVGVFSVGGGSVLLFLGQRSTTGGVAAILFSLNPVLATVFARVALPDERLAPAGLLGLLVGLAGVAVVVRPDAGLVGDFLGRVLVVSSATSVALGAVLVQRTPQSVPSTTVTAWGMAVGATGMHVLSPLLGESAAVTLAPRFLGALAYVSIVAAAGTYGVYFYLLGRVGAIRISLVSYATPVVAALTGWLLLGQPLAPIAVVGFALVVLGFALVERRALAEELGAGFSVRSWR